MNRPQSSPDGIEADDSLNITAPVKISCL